MRSVLVLGSVGAALVAACLAVLVPVYGWTGAATGTFGAQTGSWESGPSDLTCRILSLFQAELRWSPAGSPVDGYRIYHKGPWPPHAGFGLLAQIPDAAATSYDGVAPSLLRHSYFITSYSGEWESGPSNTINVHCRPRIIFPGPCGLGGENHHSQRSIDLTWEPAAGAVSYGVLRGTVSGGPYELLVTTDVPTYSDTTVSEGVTYYYVIVAVDAAGNESEPSAELTVADDTPPLRPPTAQPVDMPTPAAMTPTPTPTPTPTLTPTPTTLPESAPQAEPSDTPIPTETPLAETPVPATLGPEPTTAEAGEQAPTPTPTPTDEVDATPTPGG
jgi:hypothetical protein